MRCHLSMRICLRLSTKGLYCMTKCSVTRSALTLCCKARFLSQNLTFFRSLQHIFCINRSGNPRQKPFRKDTLFECCSGGVCSEKSQGVSLDKAFIDPCWVAGFKVLILKSFIWLKMGAQVENRFLFQSTTLEGASVQKSQKSQT